MPTSPPVHNTDSSESEIDFRELLARMRKGLPLIVGLACVLAVAATAISWVVQVRSPIDTTMRVAFSFPGFERGEYPDGSKFQADDIRSPEAAQMALKRLNLPENILEGGLRGALSVVGIISPNITKERDRLRASGQNPPPFIPDEYEVSLTLPRSSTFPIRDRELFLNELISSFSDRFRLLYTEMPPRFGSVFETLRTSDYFEYEIALKQETQDLAAFLQTIGDQAKSFRSQSTGFSFNDLTSELRLFTQIKLNDTLAVINSAGLATDRTVALRKIDYYITTLEEEEQRLTDESGVINSLLSKAQERGQSYVLSSKAEAENGKPVVNENVLDMLIANDSYNFLIHKALDAGIREQDVHAQKEQALLLKKKIADFGDQTETERRTAAEQVSKSLASLETDYAKLTNAVRLAYRDYAHQQFANAVRVTMSPQTQSIAKPIAISAGVGAALGLLLGLGVILLNAPTVNRDNASPTVQ